MPLESASVQATSLNQSQNIEHTQQDVSYNLGSFLDVSSAQKALTNSSLSLQAQLSQTASVIPPVSTDAVFGSTIEVSAKEALVGPFYVFIFCFVKNVHCLLNCKIFIFIYRCISHSF